MIFKVLFFGALAALCFGEVPIETKDNLNEELAKDIKLIPIPYNFEYNTEDVNGTSQFRKESGDGNGKVTGRYGYTDAYGVERIVEYIADENGYRAQIRTNEPGTDSMNPASVQFSAQPLVYQLPHREPQTLQPTESAEDPMKRHQVIDMENQPAETSFSNHMQAEQFSSLSPNNQQYTYYGQNEPNTIVHHANGQPPVAIPVQEIPSQYQSHSMSLYSTSEQPSTIQMSQEQQYADQKSQEQMYANQIPQIHHSTSQKSLDQQYANQAPQVQQYSSQKSQDQQQYNNQFPQVQQYATQKSSEQQYNHQKSQDQKSQDQQQYNSQFPQVQQYATQKSLHQQNANQFPQVQQHASQKSQELQYATRLPQQYSSQKSQEQQYNQKSQQIQKPQEQQYNNQKSQDLSYNTLNAQQHDSMKSQEQIVRVYNPTVQYITPSIPQQEVSAKQLYHQPAPQNLLPSAAVRRFTYSLLPVPQAYAQGNTFPLVHQYLPLQNQPVVRPVTLANTNPVEYAFHPVTTQAYSSQEKQVSTLSTSSA